MFNDKKKKTNRTKKQQYKYTSSACNKHALEKEETSNIQEDRGKTSTVLGENTGLPWYVNDQASHVDLHPTGHQ